MNNNTEPSLTSRFHVMAKPIGPLCNLNCSYCFYLHKENLLQAVNKWQMSDEVLENFIKQYIQGQTAENIVFTWQGGEPALLGIDFFEKIVAIEKKYSEPSKNIENDLQTNGVLLDESWCEFLKKNNFLVGLSIDGPKELHDIHRLDKAGNFTFDKVMNAVELLKKYDIPFNALVTVNRDNVRHPLKVYRFIRDEINPRVIQFTPVVEVKPFETVAPPFWGEIENPTPDHPMAQPGSEYSIVTDWSVNADDYGDFLCAVFDEWYQNDFGKTFVDNFECAIGQWMGGLGHMCVFSPICGKGLSIEHDGGVYSCDHFVYPEYQLGNIKDKKLDDLAFSERQAAFGFRKKEKLPQYCRNCAFIFACHGGCPKDRILTSPDGEPGLNYLCRGLKKYFQHIQPYMEKIAEQINQNSK